MSDLIPKADFVVCVCGGGLGSSHQGVGYVLHTAFLLVLFSSPGSHRHVNTACASKQHEGMQEASLISRALGFPATPKIPYMSLHAQCYLQRRSVCACVCVCSQNIFDDKLRPS